MMKKIAMVSWPSHLSVSENFHFTGSVVFEQDNKSKGCLVSIHLVGLEPYSTNAIHIHEKSFASETQLEKGCMTLGGHFNPTNNNHGSIFNGTNSERHAGDLCNNIHADENGHVNEQFFDEMISLEPRSKFFIGNKSVVIHTLSDDLGRQGRTLGTKGFKRYDQMTKAEFKIATGKDWNSSNVAEYMKGSLVTGNAGGRMACGNIILRR